MTARPSLPLLTMLGCQSADLQQISPPELRLAEDMATVVLANWVPPQESPDALRLEWLDPDGEWAATPAVEEGGAWRALAFGLRQSQDYRFRLVGTWGESVATSEEAKLQTGNLPAEAPSLTLGESGDNPGFLATGVNNSTPGGAIFDESGGPVWWWPLPVPEPYVTRVLRSVDQRSVLISAFRTIAEYDPSDLAIHRVAYDGTVLETIETPGGHHDFTELPDGTLAWWTHESRDFDGRAVRGDVLMERAPDGGNREVWNGWDHYTYDPEDSQLVDSFPHANAVKCDVETDRYWLSLRSLGALVVIDRASGAIVEQFFGRDSIYPLSPGTPVAYQHGFTLLDDGFVIMDDRKDEAEVSRAAQFTIDRTAGTFAEVWSYESDEGFHIRGLGEAIRVDGGDTLLLWSPAGQAQRVRPDGTTVWRATSQLGTVLGYGQVTVDPTALPPRR